MENYPLPKNILTTQLVIWDKEHDRVLKQIAEIKGTYASHQTMSPEDRVKLNALVARLKELRALLNIKY